METTAAVQFSSHHDLQAQDSESRYPMSGLKPPERPWEIVNQDVEFLFVVLEVSVFEDELINSVSLEADRWGNYTPPNTWMGYGSEEKVGKVFRYKNSIVSLAEGYVWYRPAPHYPGKIGKWDFAAVNLEGNPCPTFSPCLPHTNRTIFDCGPFIGTLIKMKDVSINPDYLEQDNEYYPDEEYCSEDGDGDSEDGSDYDDVKIGASSFLGASDIGITPAETEYPMYGWGDWRGESDIESWLSMKFEHDDGVSRISLGDEGLRCVAGWRPSWIPSIVASQYTNHNPQPGFSSRGLGGDMATVIGLLALTQDTGHCDEAFYRLYKSDTGKHGDKKSDEHRQAEIVWKKHKWNGTRHPNASPCSHDPRRGVVVHIAWVPGQDACQAWRNLRSFEMSGVAIREQWG